MASYEGLQERTEGFCCVNNCLTLPWVVTEEPLKGFTETKRYAKLKAFLFSTLVVFHTIVLLGMWINGAIQKHTKG